MFALLYLLTHWSLLNLGEIPADKTCSSLPQAWSVPRGDRIEPEPVMKCSYAQAATDQGGKRKRPPVSCKLYDARSKRIKKMGWKPEIVLNMCNELAKSLKPPPFSYLLSDQEASSLLNTVIGNVPLGSYIGYQLFDKKKSQTVQESIPFLTYHWLIWTTHLSLQFFINLRMMSLKKWLFLIGRITTDRKK